MSNAPNKEPPPVIRHPLFTSNPCVWYPSGRRMEGSGRPCILLARENHFMVNLLELRDGTNSIHRQVRHVDDQWFDSNPRARVSVGERDGGAWDYSDGHVYAFEVPGRPRQSAKPNAWPFDPKTGDEIIVMSQQGKAAGDIAAHFAIPGLNKAMVEKFLNLSV